MEPSSPRVNCALVDSYIAGNWEQSAAQGRVAGLNMVGQTAHYTPPASEPVVPLVLEGVTQPS